MHFSRQIGSTPDPQRDQKQRRVFPGSWMQIHRQLVLQVRINIKKTHAQSFVARVSPSLSKDERITIRANIPMNQSMFSNRLLNPSHATSFVLLQIFETLEPIQKPLLMTANGHRTAGQW